jgi:hypothetical protein
VPFVLVGLDGGVTCTLRATINELLLDPPVSATSVSTGGCVPFVLVGLVDGGAAPRVR